MQFKVGDTVRLKSGGPAMTITDIGSDTSGKPLVTCVWFATTKQEYGTFPAEAVKSVTLA